MQKNPKRHFSWQHPLLLKTHLLCVGLIFPLLPHCYLSTDVRPPPKLISHATESSSSRAGSLLGDIPLVSRKPASHLPLFYLLPFHFPALFLRKASIQKPLQWKEAGCKLFSFIAVCLTLPTFSTHLVPVSQELVPLYEGDSVSTAYLLSWTIFFLIFAHILALHQIQDRSLPKRQIYTSCKLCGQ